MDGLPENSRRPAVRATNNADRLPRPAIYNSAAQFGEEGPDVSAIFSQVSPRGDDRGDMVNIGRHPDGHPLKPLVWLANHLAARGDGLRAGQVVTTGSYCGMVDVPLATPLAVAFGDMAKIEVEFRRID